MTPEPMDYPELECEASSAAWAHQVDLLEQERAYMAHEIARMADMIARFGGAVENAHAIEVAMLEVAGLREFQLAA